MLQVKRTVVPNDQTRFVHVSQQGVPCVRVIYSHQRAVPPYEAVSTSLDDVESWDHPGIVDSVRLRIRCARGIKCSELVILRSGLRGLG